MNVGFCCFTKPHIGNKHNVSTILALSIMPAFMGRLVLLAETCVQSVSAGIFSVRRVCYAT